MGVSDYSKVSEWSVSSVGAADTSIMERDVLGDGLESTDSTLTYYEVSLQARLLHRLLCTAMLLLMPNLA